MLCAHQHLCTGCAHRHFLHHGKTNTLLGIEPVAPPPSQSPGWDVNPLHQSTTLVTPLHNSYAVTHAAIFTPEEDIRLLDKGLWANNNTSQITFWKAQLKTNSLDRMTHHYTNKSWNRSRLFVRERVEVIWELTLASLPLPLAHFFRNYGHLCPKAFSIFSQTTSAEVVPSRDLSNHHNSSVGLYPKGLFPVSEYTW